MNVLIVNGITMSVGWNLLSLPPNLSHVNMATIDHHSQLRDKTDVVGKRAPRSGRLQTEPQ
jgi:hypothetical protein